MPSGSSKKQDTFKIKMFWMLPDEGLRIFAMAGHAVRKSRLETHWDCRLVQKILSCTSPYEVSTVTKSRNVNPCHQSLLSYRERLSISLTIQLLEPITWYFSKSRSFPSLTMYQEISFNSLTYDILGNLIHFPHLRCIRKSHLIPLLTIFWEIWFISRTYDVSGNLI